MCDIINFAWPLTAPGDHPGDGVPQHDEQSRPRQPAPDLLPGAWALDVRRGLLQD